MVIVDKNGIRFPVRKINQAWLREMMLQQLGLK